MTDVIEAEVREVDEPRALVPMPQAAPQAHVLSGLGAMASLDDEAFQRNLALIKKGVERARLMQAALLEEGEDFGAVKGVKRPFLHKPGAEKFEKAYGLATRYTIERMVGDGQIAPPLQFLAHSFVHLGDFAGPIVAEGVGEANSWETKYRYRQGERVCPNCGEAAIRRGQKRDKSGDEWYCHRKANGCGRTFDIADPAIVDQDAGRVDNPDPWDLANTLVKMAKKRAYVDGILQATGTSGLFTQDDDSPTAPRPAPQPEVHDGSPVAEARTEAPDDEPVYQGQDTYTGRVSLGSSPVDGQMRLDPKGEPFVGFKLTANGKHVQVMAVGQMATVLEAACEGVTSLDGVEVTVEGALFAVPWKKDGRRMPPYKRLVMARIVAPDFEVPA